MMNHYRTAALALVAALGIAIGAQAQSCCDDCAQCASGQTCLNSATPCPCAADGVCSPNRATWGHNQGGWRRWPGDTDDPLPQRRQPRQDQQLPDVNPPIPPAIEDREAPPPSDADVEEDEPSEEGPGVGGDLPPLPPPALPFGSPLPSGDPPPALPPGLQNLQLPSPSLDDDFSSNPRFDTGVKRASLDLPPALPASLTGILQANGIRPLPPTTRQGPSRVWPVRQAHRR